MAYADETYYKGTYGGTVIPDADLPRMLAKAARTIDRATREQIGTLADWPAEQQTRIKNANCAEAEFQYQYGDVLEAISVAGGYSVGDVSVNAPQVVTALGSSGLCEETEALLYRTGLLYRGV